MSYTWMSKKSFMFPTRASRLRRYYTPFKWQWAVSCEVQDDTDFNGKWHPALTVIETRWRAREYRNEINAGKLRGVRNAKLKRRLVQVDWEEYPDTFSYNAKGNGNGR